MATLILTAVGTAVAGPLGGLLGAVAGQTIDRQWLTPGGRRGPRLADLRIQTSSYGTPIPRIYGRMRVAGTVIWSTDLIERRARQSAGKGQPKSTTYSYSASFAVALSSRRIGGVQRIWADGNILRGTDGSFTQQTGFRLHEGGEAQAADPLIAAAEGPGGAPAYRGIAYAVFEDMDLSPFGNRIPSLTFEVEADAGSVRFGTPMADLLDGLDGVAHSPAMTGYVVGGGSRRDALGPLMAVQPIKRALGGDGGGWSVADDAAAISNAAALPAPAALARPAAPERRLGGADRLPRDITLSHFDPARDFQTGVQVATLAGAGAGGSGLSFDLPVALDAAAARALAEQAARRARAAQRSAEWSAGLGGLALPPGQAVLADDSVMLVAERRIEGGVAMLALSGLAARQTTDFAADSGRAVTAPDLPTGDTVAALFDLPALSAADVDQPRLMLAATGSGAGWRRAAVSVEAINGGAPAALESARTVAVLGTVSAHGGVATTALFDDVSWIEVKLARADMQLSNADDDDLLAGANAAMIGAELMQFGLASPLGQRRWRLSHLLRGRRGTEDAVAGLTIGAAFTLIDDPALLAIGDAQIGGSVTVAATGSAAPLTLPITAAGRAARPLAPVHMRAERQADGGALIRWTRSSRIGFDWRDGVDAPLDALPERYHVTVSAGAAQISALRDQPDWPVSAATIAAWQAAGATSVTFVVQHVGALALSSGTTTTLNL